MKKNSIIIVAIIIAIAGISFGVFGVIQNQEKDTRIAKLESQIDSVNRKLATKPGTDNPIIKTAIVAEQSIPWPDDIEMEKDDPAIITNKITLPEIDLGSNGAQLINNKISEKYSKYLSEEQEYPKGPYSIDIDYDTIIRDDIVYLIIYSKTISYRATSSSTLDIYYYDVKNDTELSVQDIATKYNIPQSASIIIPSIVDSFYYYTQDNSNCYRMGCEVINSTI